MKKLFLALLILMSSCASVEWHWGPCKHEKHRLRYDRKRGYEEYNKNLKHKIYGRVTNQI